MTIRPNLSRLLPPFCLLAVLCLVAAACGLKSWPKPNAKEDRFEWQSVDFARKGGCLDISARLKGAAKNLDRVLLQLQPEDSGCSGCPFSPDILLEFGPGSQEFTQSDREVHLTTCALAPNKAYRFRLAGANLYTALGLSMSGVQTSPPSTP